MLMYEEICLPSAWTALPYPHIHHSLLQHEGSHR